MAKNNMIFCVKKRKLKLTPEHAEKRYAFATIIGFVEGCEDQYHVH
jgi:hypothetical protein